MPGARALLAATVLACAAAGLAMLAMVQPRATPSAAVFVAAVVPPPSTIALRDSSWSPPPPPPRHDRSVYTGYVRPHRIRLAYAPDPVLGPRQQAQMRSCPRVAFEYLEGNLTYGKHRMPDFIIMGVQKGGTSALARNLQIAQPEVVIPREEVHFFDNFLHRGPAWYSATLRKALDWFPARKQSRVLWGDKSPSYVFMRDVPAAIAKYVPDIKLIVALREPTARAFSAYRMRAGRGLENRTFAAAVDEEIAALLREQRTGDKFGSGLGGQGHLGSQYIQRGFYAKQLANVLKHFKRCQLHVTISERLANTATRVQEMHRMLWFLGISSAGNHTYRTFNTRTIEKMHNATPVSWEWNDTNVVNARRKMHSLFFAQENQRLFEFLGKDVQEWKLDVSST